VHDQPESDVAERRLYLLSFFAGFVDLLAAAVLVVAEGLDAVLLQDVAGRGLGQTDPVLFPARG
jgi:hypothetical protein